MPTLRKPQLRKLSAGAALAAALTPPPHAAAALLVHEPFDYPAVSTPLLDGTVATGLNLTGTYVSDVVHPLFQLRLSSPGLSYGNLASAPSATGAKLTQLNGSTSNGATVSLADPVRILPGQAIFFSALFTLDDSRNGNHRAQVQLLDGEDEIAFGEPVVGGRAIRAHAKTAATGGLADTVIHANPAAVAAGAATGITFHPTDALAFSGALRRLVELHADRPGWERVQRQAMRSDVGWSRSSAAYAALYERLTD